MSGLKDVADLANVSTTTVSVILKGGERSRLYAPETVQRVLQAAKKLDYAPSRRGLGIAHGKNYCVSMFVDMYIREDHPYFPTVFTGLAEQMRIAGYAVEMSRIYEHRKEIEQLCRNTDGVIFVVTAPPEAVRIVSENCGLPVVFANAGIFQRTNCINPDDWTGARLVGEHILKIGYEKVLYTHNISSHPSIQIRRDSLHAAVASLEFRSMEVTEFIESDVFARLAAGQLPKTAIVTADDQSILNILNAAMHHRLKVPEDFGLASCHMGPYYQGSDRGMRLTGATHNLGKLGARAGHMLLEIIDGKESIPSELIEETLIQGATTVKQD